jgi:hypothetical protein
VVVAGSLVGALAVLTFVDDAQRVWWFRGYVAVIGMLAARAVLRWLDALPRIVRPEPFRRKRLRWRRRPVPPSRRGSERVLHLASFAAGDAHRGLRPILQEIADERLRARYGITLDDPTAQDRLAPATWELVRPDRPVPHDLRAPGVDPDTIDALLTDLEAL